MTPTAPPEMPDRAEEIFLEVLEIQDPLEREIRLAELIAGDRELRISVQSMLDDYPKASQFFQITTRHLNYPEELLPNEHLYEGNLIGSYRIIKLLDEGGSSNVYEAEQTEPVQRKVAVKILKFGMDSKTVIHRFEAERQTLAMLEHPNISQVFDAGITSLGRPFFVMELVGGEKITTFCRRHHTSVDQRIRLMIKVCSAVQHAHNKGVIHRDIKPSNILLSSVDGMPTPKLIDFGIAKVTATANSEMRTMFGQPMGTPAYMSPEQIRGDPIDTRSDVYSLGILLYELLAGRTPIDNETLVGTGTYEMQRRVLFDIPAKPVNAKARGSTAREELNWIVMKAIEKDREDRYSTAHALAADLECYLANEPLRAHPPSRLYHFRKLIQRNRLASVTTAIAIIALTIGFTVSSMMYIRARAAEIEQTHLKELAEERAYVTKAAILIMQDKMAEADAEIQRMGGLLTQPSIEATNVFRTLALWNGKNGNWKTSADRWLAMARVNQFDESDMSEKVTENLLPIAPILVMTEDYQRYHEHQNFLLERLANTIYPIATEHLIKLCLLTPANEVLLERLAHAANVAENSLPGDETTAPEDRMESWRCVSLALWYLRNQQPYEALSWSNRALLFEDWEKARSCIATLIRAMARESTGDRQGALSDLNHGQALVSLYLNDPIDNPRFGHFHDWLIADIMLKETQKRMNASANDSPPA